MVAVALGASLPGCPLSDKYFVDPRAGVAGSDPGTGGTAAESGGVGGSGMIAGGPATGGSTAATGGDSGTGGAGTGGEAATGGSGGTESMGNGGEAGVGAETSTGGTSGSAGCVSELERCDGISNDCDDEIDEDSVCPTGCTARFRDNHTYVLCVAARSDDELACDDASLTCGSLGEEFGTSLPLGLAWIESSDENDFLKDWVSDEAPSDGVVWMGATDQSSENRWVWGRRAEAEQFFTGDSDGGGTPYMGRFNDWGPGRPSSQNGYDQDCGAFDSMEDWQWNDRPCDWLEVGFVCEEHPTPQARAR